MVFRSLPSLSSIKKYIPFERLERSIDVIPSEVSLSDNTAFPKTSTTLAFTTLVVDDILTTSLNGLGYTEV